MPALSPLPQPAAVGRAPLADRPIAIWFGPLGLTAALTVWPASFFWIIVCLGERDRHASEAEQAIQQASKQVFLHRFGLIIAIIAAAALVLAWLGRRRTPIPSGIAIVLTALWVALVVYVGKDFV